MKSALFFVFALVVCCWWSCADRQQQRRAELDMQYRIDRERFYNIECEKPCGAAFDKCTRREGHASLACSQRYNDCARDCAPRRDR